MLKKLLVIKGKEDSNMEWTGEALLKLMEPIAKKYHLVRSIDNHPYCDGWSYDNNTIKWVKEKRIPVDNDTVITTSPIDAKCGDIRIHDMYINSGQLKNLSSNKLSQIIRNSLFIHTYSTDFVDRASQDTLVPATGKFICWKKCCALCGPARLVKLEVPAKAKRFQALGTAKFRVSEAKVVGIYNTKGNMVKDTEVYSTWDNKFKYTLAEGVTIYPDSWDDTDTICSHGIHAFMRFNDAKNY